MADSPNVHFLTALAKLAIPCDDYQNHPNFQALPKSTNDPLWHSFMTPPFGLTAFEVEAIKNVRFRTLTQLLQAGKYRSCLPVCLLLLGARRCADRSHRGFLLYFCLFVVSRCYVIVLLAGNTSNKRRRTSETVTMTVRFLSRQDDHVEQEIRDLPWLMKRRYGKGSNMSLLCRDCYRSLYTQFKEILSKGIATDADSKFRLIPHRTT